MSRLPAGSSNPYDSYAAESDYFYQNSRGCYQEGYVEQVVFNPNVTEIYPRRPAPVEEPEYTECFYDHREPVYVVQQPNHWRQSQTPAFYGDERPIKRYPITVKTPRYVKKPAAPGALKKPSLLCLPVASQCDSQKMSRKPKKLIHGVKAPEAMRPQEVNHQIHSEGDGCAAHGNHLDELLAQYEEESKCEQTEANVDLVKMATKIKPRMPLSIKMREERQRQKRFRNFDIQELPKTELSTADGEVPLDKLLHKLQLTKDIADEKSAKSYNYKEIQEQFRKSNTVPEATSVEQHHAAVEEVSANVSSQTAADEEENCGIDLHRSKSYIVNLIDRALSKELGTAPCEKFETEKGEQMDPRRAVELVDKHSRQMAKVNCKCKEEPGYMKQLRKLRWGHLKHIQKEMRRLEDLERFLDSCHDVQDEEETN